MKETFWKVCQLFTTAAQPFQLQAIGCMTSFATASTLRGEMPCMAQRRVYGVVSGWDNSGVNTNQYRSPSVYITRPHHPNPPRTQQLQLASSFPSCTSGCSRSLCPHSFFLLLGCLRPTGFTRPLFRNTSLKAPGGPAWMARRLFRGRRWMTTTVTV